MFIKEPVVKDAQAITKAKARIDTLHEIINEDVKAKIKKAIEKESRAWQKDEAKARIDLLHKIIDSVKEKIEKAIEKYNLKIFFLKKEEVTEQNCDNYMSTFFRIGKVERDGSMSDSKCITLTSDFKEFYVRGDLFTKTQIIEEIRLIEELNKIIGKKDCLNDRRDLLIWGIRMSDKSFKV